MRTTTVRLEVFIVQLAAITSCSVMDPAAGQAPAMWAMPCNASDPTQQWALTSDPMGTSSHGRVHHPVYLSRNSLENIPGGGVQMSLLPCMPRRGRRADQRAARRECHGHRSVAAALLGDRRLLLDAGGQGRAQGDMFRLSVFRKAAGEYDRKSGTCINWLSQVLGSEVTIGYTPRSGSTAASRCRPAASARLAKAPTAPATERSPSGATGASCRPWTATASG